jgi:hypothetical protein
MASQTKKPFAHRGVPQPFAENGFRCKVCCDPRLRKITTDLAAGMSQSAVAKKYGFTQPVVWHHATEHMGARLLEHNIYGPVVDQLRNLQHRTDRILAKAEKAQDLMTALRGVHEARENLLGIARLTGEDRSAQKSEPVRIEIAYIDKQLVLERGDDPEPPPAIEAPSNSAVDCEENG